MKILYGLIYEMDFSIQYMYVFLFCCLIILPILHHFMKEHIKVWSVLCMIPLVIYIAFLCKERYAGNIELTIQRYH